MKRRTSSQLLSRTIATMVIVGFFFSPIIKIHAQGIPVIAPTSDAIAVKNTLEQTIQTTLASKEWLQTAMQQVAKGLAMQVLKKFTQETVNWINQGNDGKPLYVTNTGDFFDSIADEQVKILTNKIGYDPAKYPYAKDFLQYYITAYARKKLDPLATNTYTLPNSCATNFTWSCWNARVSNSANNPFGAFFETSRAIDQKINTAVSIADKEVSAAGGFLAVKTCELFQPAPIIPQETVTGPADNNPGLGSQTNSAGSGMGAMEQSGFTFDETGTLVVSTGTSTTSSSNTTTNTTDTTNPNGINTGNPTNAPVVMGPGNTTNVAPTGSPCAKYTNSTPGTVVGNQITTALSSGTRQNELAAALGSSVSAIFDALYNRFVGQGLNALSTSLFDSATANNQQNTFNYYGVTLGNTSTTTVTTDDWASGPDIIVDLNQVLGVPYTDGTVPEGPSSLDLTVQEANSLQSITTTLKQFPDTLNQLDKCLPGPDYGWEARFNTALQEESAKIDKKIAKASDTNEPAEAAADELKGIKQRVDLAILLMRDRMVSKNIPSALTIYDAVNANAQKSLKYNEYYQKYLEKKTTVRRIEILKAQYAAGSDIVPIMMQYQAIKPMISRQDTIAATDSDRLNFETQRQELIDLTGQCLTERAAIAAAHPVVGEAMGTENNAYYNGYHSYYYDQNEGGANPYYPTNFSNVGLTAAFLGGPIAPIIVGVAALNQIPAIIPPEFPIYGPVIQQGGGGNSNYPAHMSYYCRQVIDSCPPSSGENDTATFVNANSNPSCITLDDVFKTRDFELSCFDFYNSNLTDYIVEN